MGNNKKSEQRILTSKNIIEAAMQLGFMQKLLNECRAELAKGSKMDTDLIRKRFGTMEHQIDAVANRLAGMSTVECQLDGEYKKLND